MANASRKSQDLKVAVSEHVTVLGDLQYQHYRRKPTGGKEVLGEGKVGTELHSDTQTYQYRRRQLDYIDYRYEKEIHNQQTGYSVNISKDLRTHKGHGTAKKTNRLPLT